MVSSRADEIKAAGASRLVALVKEDVGSEVNDFRAFWKQEVLLDTNRSFYSAIAGGTEHKPVCGLASLLALLANPFSRSRSRANILGMKAKGNTTGEGYVSGGVYVIQPDGRAAYSFLEEELGDKAPIDDVIAAVRKSVEAAKQ